MTTIELLDLRSWRVFHDMTARGILVDRKRMQDLVNEINAKIEEQEALIGFYAGDGFNPSSAQQVAEYLERMGHTGKRTTGGQLATDEKSLSRIEDPVIQCVLEYRGLKKMAGTFLQPILDMTKDNATVHPKWKLTRVRSGRVAMEDPNLLAFPSRTAEGKQVRSCFIPTGGMKLISVDYSQLEPRIIAGLSGDPKLLKIYAENRDLYSEIAATLGITRTVAKTVTLGTAYGMGPHKLYEQLIAVGCVTPKGDPQYFVEDCQGLLDGWFNTYHYVKDLVKRTVHEARQSGGYAKTMAGRTRYLPGLFINGAWPANKLREEAERQAFNHLIQGTGAETIKEAMVRISTRVPECYQLLQIHDEIVAESPKPEKVLPLMRQCMELDFMGVKLTTSGSTGDNWGALK